MVALGGRRDAAVHAQKVFGLSERRACRPCGHQPGCSAYRSTELMRFGVFGSANW